MSFIDGLTRNSLSNFNNQLQIFIKKNIYEQLKDYCRTDTTQELGGILLGTVESNAFGTILNISGLILPSFHDSFLTELRFDHSLWKNIYDEKNSRFPTENILGWFNTHPGQELIPSDDDIQIHKAFFKMAYQVLFLLDPNSGNETFYHWETSHLVPLPDFIILEKGTSPREALDAIAASAELDGNELSENNPYLERIKELNNFLQEGAACKKIRERHDLTSQPESTTVQFPSFVREVPTSMKGLVLVAALLSLSMLFLYPVVKPVKENRIAVGPPIESPIQQPERAKEKAPVTVRDVYLPPDKPQQQTAKDVYSPQPSQSVSNVKGPKVATYTVQRGDSLWKISEKFYGTGFDFYKILRHNKIINPNNLYSGMILEIPANN